MKGTPSLVVIVPGTLDTCSGGYEYDRRIAAGLRDRGWAVEVRELGGSFPHPTSDTLARAARVLGEIPDETVVVVDGLALGALPDEIEREAGRLRLVALVHHPLAAETGLDPSTASRLEQSERRALGVARTVVVTSRATAENLASYSVDRQRIAVVEPGTDRAPVARGSGEGCVHLLCVAAVIPRKGHEVLVQALTDVPERNWRLTCLGNLDRDPLTVERLRARVVAGDLSDRVVLAGEGHGSVVAAHYDRADVFVMPTLHEGYGMAVAEALVRGLPVVGTATGAIPDLLNGLSDDVGRHHDEHGPMELLAGLLVPPGDVDRLAAALSLVIRDVEVRNRLARGARRVRDCLPSWEEASDKMAQVLIGVAEVR